MGWGILESGRTPFPQGTSRVGVKDAASDEAPGVNTAEGSGAVVLSPEPSDDPNDPLNWTFTWKWVHLFVLAFGSALTNAQTTMLVPGLAPLTEKIKSNDADVSTWLVTAPTFWTSAAAFFFISATEIWGRRPFYVWTVVLLAMTNFAGYFSSTFPMLAVARTANGLFSAPLLTILTATIADIFFVHQRGKSIALWNLMLNAGAQVGQVIAGFVTDALGVSANFGILGFFYTALIPLVYFTIFESAYFKRNTDTAAAVTVAPNKLDDEWDIEDAKAANRIPSWPYRERLALSRGRLSDKSFWKGVIKPLGLVTSPIVIYSIVLNMGMLIFLGAVPTFLSILLSAEPYNLTPTQIGLTNLPLFVVGLFTSPLFGWMSDALVQLMARNNRTKKGIAEPEFRLVLLLVSTPLIMAGLIGLGKSIEEGLPLPWVLLWMTVTNVGAVTGVQISLAYVIDCHPQHSAQVGASINMISSGFITVINGPLIAWLEAAGPLTVFGTLASVAAIITAAGLPNYVFGKKFRAWYGSRAWAQRLLD